MAGRSMDRSKARNTQRKKTLSQGVLFAAIVTALLLHPAIVLNADEPLQVQIARPAVVPAPDQPPINNQGATLESNPDAESLLNRAHEYIGQDQHREALLLLQHVLDRYGEALTPDRYGVYVPARRAVEKIIATLGEAGLGAYRVSADGEAQALVEGDVAASRDAEALEQVVGRYFISSVGDDAAFALGCLLAERGEHARAAWLFRRIIEDYPDPSVDITGVRARLAIALARGGATTAAKVEAAKLAGNPRTPTTVNRLVDRAIEASSQRTAVASSDQWTMAFGSPQRSAVMPTLEVEKLPHRKGVLALLWKRQQALRSEERTWGGVRQHSHQNQRQSRPGLITRWTQHGWLPTGQIVYRDGRVYQKTYDSVICRDAETGRELWTDKHVPESSESTRFYSSYSYYHSSRDTETPTSIEEVLLFGDRIGSSMSIIGDRIYYIGAQQLAGLPNDRQREQVRSRNLALGNQLVALDATTGKNLWRRGRSKRERGGEFEEARFLAPPVPSDPGDPNCGVITAVERSGELFLVKFDRAGRVVWQTFLCARPSVPAPRWHATALTVHGDQVYVLPGEGVVVAASRQDGSINWAARYERDVPEKVNYYHTLNGFGRSDGVRGWPENALFVTGGAVVATAWDSESIVVLDEQTGRWFRRPNGEPIGQIKVRQPGHVVGMSGNLLVYYADQELTALDVTTAELGWKSPVGDVTGRAALTERAIYVPAGEHVLQLDPNRDGKLIAKVRTVTPFGDPVGNLYCDGQRLLAVGADHLYAMVEGDSYLASLTKRIEENDEPSTRLARAQLSQQMGNRAQAIDDYREVFATAEDDKTRELARGALVDVLLADVKTADAPLERLAEAQQLAADTADAPRVQFARAEYLATANPAEAVPLYVDVVNAADSDESMIDLGDALGDGLGEWQVAAAALSAGQIDKMLAADDGTLAPIIEQSAAEALAAAEAITQPSRRFKALGRVAANYPRTPSVLAALEQMRQFDPLIGFETVQSMLMRLSNEPHVPTAAAAQRALAEMYEWKGMDQQAARAWETYSRRFADLAMGTEEAPLTGEQFAGQRLAALDAEPPSPNQMPAPPWKKLWEMRGSGTYVLTIDDADESQFLSSHVLLLTQNRRSLKCYPTRGTDLNKPVWQIDVPTNVANRIRYYNNTVAFSGVAGGNVIVFRDTDKMLAYGLISGKLLWQADAEQVEQNQSSSALYRTLQLQQQQGFGSMAVDQTVMLEHAITDQFIDQVVARDVVTGHVLWRRSFDERSVDGVHASDGRAVIVTNAGANLVLCDQRTGKVIADIERRGNNGNVQLVFAGRFVMYQDGPNAICLDLTTGEEAWRRPSQGYGRFGDAGGRWAFVHDHQRNLHLMPLVDGHKPVKIAEKTLDLNTDSVAVSPDGKELFCVGYDNSRNRILAVVDIDTGQRVARIDFGRTYAVQIPASTYARCGEYLPWLGRIRNPNGSYTSDYELQFYRKSTGKRYTEHKLPSRLGDSKFKYMYRPPTVVGGAVIAVTNQGVEAFGAADPKPADDKADEADNAGEPQAGTGEHIVKPGDTLAKIARRHYGDANQWQRIAEANKAVLPSPDQLKIGTKLTIPPRADQQAANGEAPAQATRPAPNPVRGHDNAANDQSSIRIEKRVIKLKPGQDEPAQATPAEQATEETAE